MTTLPLENILILDFTRLLPGPFATQILADLGARVIRIESPLTDLTRFIPPFIKGKNEEEIWSGLFLALNRNKESISLNLKKNNHKQILSHLIQKADIIIEGFRPGIMHKLGFDYESVKKINNKIIYCSLSGFGQSGVMKDAPAHDINYVGLAGGFSNIALNKDSNSYPPIDLPLTPIADLSGAMFAIVGILTTLFARLKSGMGCYIDTSLFESVFYWLSGYSGTLEALNGNETKKQNIENERSGHFNNFLSGGYPFYSLYITKDNKWLSVGALEPVFWKEFCNILDFPGLIDSQHYASSPEELKEIYYKIQKKFLSKDLDEWIEVFKGKNTCVYPVNTITEVRDNQQLDIRKMLLKVPHPAGGNYFVPNLPLKFSEWKKKSFPRKPPDMGENSLKILKEFGIDKDLF